MIGEQKRWSVTDFHFLHWGTGVDFMETNQMFKVPSLFSGLSLFFFFFPPLGPYLWTVCNKQDITSAAIST